MPKPKPKTLLDLMNARRDQLRAYGEAPPPISEVLEAARISRAYFYALAAGRRTPSPQVVERLAEALDVSLKDIHAALAEAIA